MSASSSDSAVARLARERDLYRRLLELGERTAIEPFLEDALALVVEVVGARHGYLELREPDDDGAEPRWSRAHGFSPEEVAAVRAVTSRGIVAASLASGETIVTPSALLDPRFRDRESVRLARIEAVLCAPLAADPPLGVLYLQGRTAGGLFTEDDRTAAELVARHLAPAARRLLAGAREAAATDPTAAARRALRLHGVVGRSRALAAVLNEVALVSPLDVTVLLTGPSGTGKSQIARVIHDNGPRRGGPFVEVNCAALPVELLESELFGALPGAHSTATRRLEGKVAAAERGTLFLDEVGELPLSAQGKLLQLLHARTYFPLGGTKPLTADVRVIAATNVDLEAAVAARTFREDLFYRLQVLPVRLPALAERREDIVPLAEFLCARACERHRLPRLEFSPDALRALEASEWPGNVRQLANAVEAAAIRAAGTGAARIERAHLFPGAASGAASGRGHLTFQEATRQFQATLLRRTLAESGWNVVEAARRLDLARSHVYSLLRAFGIEREKR